jgi:hypothetical protein
MIFAPIRQLSFARIKGFAVHPDTASAAADFIHRLAAWLARREIL